MKRLISILLCVLMIMSLFTVAMTSTSAAQTDVATTGASYKDNIINSIIEEEWYWYNHAYIYQGHYGYTSFYFADLNYDGNLEFIVWEPGGTMGNISNTVYYYEGELWRAAHNEESDIVDGFSTMQLSSYYNKNTGNFKTLGQAISRENFTCYSTQDFKVSFDADLSFVDIDYYAGMFYNNGTYKYYTGANAPKYWGDISGKGSSSATNYNKVINNATASSTYADAKMSYDMVSLDGWEYYSEYTKRQLLSDAYDSFSLKSSLVSTPTLSKLDATPDGVKVSWNKVSGATRYRVFKKVDSKWKTVGDTTGTSLVDTSATTVGSSYTYTVRAMSKNGAYPVSSYNKTGKTIKILDNPVITRTANAQNGVKIEWAPVAGAEKYRVYVRGGSATSWKKKCDTTSTSYIHETTKSNTEYEYTVRCVTSSGKSCRSSYYDPGVFHTFIATPKISKVANTEYGVKVTWGAVAGAQAYRVYVKGGSAKSWKSIGTTTSTSFYHETARSNTTYTYTVRCISFDGTDVSSYSRTGKSIKFFAAPVLYYTEMISDDEMYIEWDKIPGVAKYKVFIWYNGKWESLGYISDHYGVYSPVYPGYSYTFTIRCCDSKGNYLSSYLKDGVTIDVYYTDYYAMTGSDGDNTTTETIPQLPMIKEYTK